MSNNNNVDPYAKHRPPYFLYSKSFLGVEPPFQILAFCIFPAVFYLLCVFVIWPRLAPSTKDSVLRWAKIRDLHNLLLCIYSGATTAYGIYDMSVSGEIVFFKFFATFDNKYLTPMLCNPVSNNLYLILGVVFTWSKVYEMLDTMFIVFLKNDFARGILEAAKPKKEITENKEEGGRNTATTRTTVGGGEEGAAGKKKKKAENDSELSFLHVFHHMTTFWLFLLVCDFPGALRGGVLNAFVHTLMYYHYFFRLPKLLASCLTTLQIIQLAFVTYIWSLTPGTCKEFADFPTKHKAEFWTPYFMVPVFLVFFVKFFIEKYILPLFAEKPKTE